MCVLCFISSTKNLEVGSRHLFSSSTPESAAATTAESAKPAAATTEAITPKSTAAEAITAESASTAAAIKAAALKALEPLA